MYIKCSSEQCYDAYKVFKWYTMQSVVLQSPGDGFALLSADRVALGGRGLQKRRIITYQVIAGGGAGRGHKIKVNEMYTHSFRYSIHNTPAEVIHVVYTYSLLPRELKQVPVTLQPHPTKIPLWVTPHPGPLGMTCLVCPSWGNWGNPLGYPNFN